MFIEHLLCVKHWASCGISKISSLFLGVRVNNIVFGLQKLKDEERAVERGVKTDACPGGIITDDNGSAYKDLECHTEREGHTENFFNVYICC